MSPHAITIIFGFFVIVFIVFVIVTMQTGIFVEVGDVCRHFHFFEARQMTSDFSSAESQNAERRNKDSSGIVIQETKATTVGKVHGTGS